MEEEEELRRKRSAEFQPQRRFEREWEGEGSLWDRQQQYWKVECEVGGRRGGGGSGGGRRRKGEKRERKKERNVSERNVPNK